MSTVDDAQTESSDLPFYPLQRECPYRPSGDTARFREDGPITKVRLYDGKVAWFVTGPAEVRSLLADTRVSSLSTYPNYPVIDESLLHMRATREMAREVEGGFPEVLFGVDPPAHTRQRKMLLPVFTARKIAKYRPAIQRIVDQRLDALLAAGPGADFMTQFAIPVPLMVVCLFLGVPYEEHDIFYGSMRGLLNPDHAEEALEEFTGYLNQLIEAKAAAPGEGMLDEMIASHVSKGELTQDELVAYALAILMAGTATTTSAISLGTLALLDHPGQYTALSGDPALVPGAIEEILRYVNLVEQLIRVATQDIEMAGQVIKSGDGLLLSCAAANLDPSITTHPDTFDITRPPSGALAFSHGLHHCLGQNLAKAELEIVFRTLTERIPTLRPAVPVSEIPWEYDFIVSRLLSFPVTW
jgi:cytochrome P450